MSRKPKVIVILALVLWTAAWIRIGLQGWTKVSPPRIARYELAQESNWTGAGFPHCRAPYLIERGVIWKLCMYGKDQGGTQSGFVRFDLISGVAQMRWPMPGASRFATIRAAARHDDGRIAVLWDLSPGSKRQISVLLPRGGVSSLGEISVSRTFRIAGLAWVDGRVEVAAAGKNITTVHRNISSGRWTQRKIPWPAHDYLRTSLGLSRPIKGKWQTVLLGRISPTGADRDTPEDAEVLLFSEGDQRLKKIATVKVSRSGEWSWLDQAPANIVDGSIGSHRRYRLEGNAIVEEAAGPLASRLPKSQPDHYYRIFTMAPNGLQRVLLWKNRTDTGYVLQYPGGQEYYFEAERSTEARRNRLVMRVDTSPTKKGAPIVESFRFRSISVLAPMDGGHGMLGTFGYYVHLDSAQRRADPLSIWERFVRLEEQFGSRQAQYDDFLLEQAWLKRLVLPIILLGPLCLWLLISGGRRLVRAAARGKSAGSESGLSSLAGWASLIYLVLFAAGAYWFWMISVNF